VISDEHRQRITTRNAFFPGTVLVDGFVAGMWRLERSAEAAALLVQPFRKISSDDEAAVGAEGLRMLAFAAPGSAHDVRFGPVG
jgi:hypothetical protein